MSSCLTAVVSTGGEQGIIAGMSFLAQDFVCLNSPLYETYSLFQCDIDFCSHREEGFVPSNYVKKIGLDSEE